MIQIVSEKRFSSFHLFPDRIQCEELLRVAPLASQKVDHEVNNGFCRQQS
jgi:hypothetical protein